VRKHGAYVIFWPQQRCDTIQLISKDCCTYCAISRGSNNHYDGNAFKRKPYIRSKIEQPSQTVSRISICHQTKDGLRIATVRMISSRGGLITKHRPLLLAVRCSFWI